MPRQSAIDPEQRPHKNQCISLWKAAIGKNGVGVITLLLGGVGMGQKGSSLLNSDDLYLFLDIAEACHSIASQQFTASIYPRLQELLPHDGFACAAVHPISGRVLRYINISFPQNQLELCDQIGTSLHCALVKKWIRVCRPVFHSKNELNEHDQTDSETIPLRNVAIHGVVNGSRRHASCYVFSNLNDAWQPRQMLILKLLTPHLHTLFMPALRGENSDYSLRKPLSQREHEVLDALIEGKTGAEIARALHISTSTVRVHIRHILEKFDTNSVIGAVSKAHQIGLHARNESDSYDALKDNRVRAHTRARTRA